MAALAAPAPLHALTADWTGFARAEAYFGKSPEKAAFGAYHLALKPELQIIDGLRVFSRLDLRSKDADHFRPAPGFFRSAGALFFAGKSKAAAAGLSDSPLFLKVSQFYLSYETEFFRLNIGRAPLDFGLGVTYSAERGHFERWLSLGDQLSLRLEREPFYLQPAIVCQLCPAGGAFALLQGGLKGASWNLEGFWRHHFGGAASGSPAEAGGAEVFGEYGAAKWDIQSSFSWLFQEEKTAMGWALEGGMEIPIALSPRLEAKAGFASEGFSFHPGYDAALLFWNHYFAAPPAGAAGAAQADKIFIEEGRISHGAYFAPRLVFSLLEEGSLELSPNAAARQSFQGKKFDYEIGLQADWKTESRLFFGLQGGWLFQGKSSFFGFLAKAAAAF